MIGFKIFTHRSTAAISQAHRMAGHQMNTVLHGWSKYSRKRPEVRREDSWRLLFIDGHGSHLNMKFIERCFELKILLAIYPPHSTHRLQPLDVSCFNPLANYYSQGLAELIAKSAGHISIKKRDFFPIFWNAYGKAFNEKNISSAWLKTGIWPFNPQIVLDNLPARRMRTPPSMNSMDPICSSPLAEPITPTRSRKLRKQVFRASAKTDVTSLESYHRFVRSACQEVCGPDDHKTGH